MKNVHQDTKWINLHVRTVYPDLFISYFGVHSLLEKYSIIQLFVNFVWRCVILQVPKTSQRLKSQSSLGQ